MSPSRYYLLADAMARMSLRADAKRFFLGYLWWIIEPFLYVGVFYVVFTLILTSRQEDFLVFLMTGKFVYLWFAKSVTQASNSIVTGKGLISKLNIPKTLFPLAVIQESLYKQFAVFLLLFAVLIYNGYSISLNWLYLIPVIAVSYVMILACGYVGATIVCIVRDFFPLISLGMLFMMFTSGVFWNVRDLGSQEKTDLVLTYNPLAFLLDAYRQILLYDTPPDMLHLFAIFIVFFVALLAIGGIMRRNSQFLALRALTA